MSVDNTFSPTIPRRHCLKNKLSLRISQRPRPRSPTIRSLSRDVLVAFYGFLSQEIGQTDETDDAYDQAHSDDGAEGLSPLSELDGLGNDKLASYAFLRKEFQKHP